MKEQNIEMDRILREVEFGLISGLPLTKLV